MKKYSVRGLAVFAALAFGAVGAAFAIAGHPLVDPTLFAAMGMVPFAVGETDVLKEIKSLIDRQGEAWEEFKRTQDAINKGKADGKAVGDLEAKLAKISDDLDKLSDLKADFDALVKQVGRPGGGNVKETQELADEAKSWNMQLRADFQSKGRPVPAELSVDEYVHYNSAFFAMARHGNPDRLSAEERKALSAGSDPDGGYLLPAATVGRMVARIWERSVIRRLATVQTISTDALEGIVDNDETDAGWVSEIGSRSSNDGTPQLGKYRIEAHEMYCSPKITQKLIDDAATNVEAWLSGKVGDKFARVEGNSFLNGNGVGQPKGLFTYTTAATGDDSRAWGQFEHVVTGANGAFHTTKGDPLMDLIGAFKDEYLQRAQWLMRREVRTLIRKLKEATSDRYLWEPGMQAGVPDRLLGYPVNIDQYVPAVATGSLSLALGDFAEAFIIVDRMGVRTLRDPYTAKPYVVFYSTRRTGSGAVNFEAVKFLKFST